MRAGLGLVLAALIVFLIPTTHGFAQVQDQAAPPKDKTAKTLYERMGGYDVISAVVEDFIAQLGKDPMFERFGGGRARTSLARTKQLIKDQVCWMTDGPCVYIGRDMAPAHQGLEITTKEWEAAGKKLQAALEKYKVPAKEQTEVMALVEKLRDDIIEKPKKNDSKQAAASPAQN